MTRRFETCRVAFLVMVLLGVGVSSVGCDATAILYTNQRKWDRLYVISAYPMDQNYKPMCRAEKEDPAGALFNVLFQGTADKSDETEFDMSIKPHDFVDNKFIEEDLVTAELFTLNLDCMEKTPDPPPPECGEGALKGGEVAIDRVEFTSPGRVNPDKNNVALAVVMDMSGSMKGLVNPRPPFNEDPLEVVSKEIVGVPFGENATDKDSARFAALEAALTTLNPDDSLIMFHFNEKEIGVVCALPDKPDADFETKKKECCGTNRSLIFDTAYELLKGEERGRSPLWSAVYEVYNYMKNEATCAKDVGFRHILVITDGPDTCTESADMSKCTGPCLRNNTPYKEVKALVEADPPEERIPVHFVQLQAKGYPERDPLQMELSCLTGGQYVFLNMYEIPETNRADILSRVLTRIRYTFRGVWRFAVRFGSLKKGAAPDVGYTYALQGSGKVLPGKQSILVRNESSFDFKVNDDVASSTNNADLRVSLRKECDPDPAAENVCPPKSKEGECAERVWWCDSETLVCRSALKWVDNGEKGGCPAMAAEVNVTISTKVGEGGETTEYETVSLGKVPTRCCGGLCTPPKPPEIPHEVNQPEGSTKACLVYDEGKGWMLKDPADPSAGWVYFAKVNQTTECMWNDIKEYIRYESVDDLAYECNAENCFPPPE